MQDEQRIVAELRQIPLLEAVSDDDLKTAAAACELREGRRRRLIFMPGDPGDGVYFVLNGRVKLSRVTPDGKELTMAYRGAGEIFGETCLVDGGHREDMAESVESGTLCHMPRPVLQQLIVDYADLGFSFCMLLVDRSRDLERKIADLIFKDVNTKLAELLIQLADEHGVADPQGTLVATKITHQEMANLIGSTRETVSLTLSQFKKKSWIATAGRKLIVTDREALLAMT